MDLAKRIALKCYHVTQLGSQSIFLKKKSCFLNRFLGIRVHTHTFLVAWKQKMVKRIFGNFDKETVTMSGVALNSPPGKRVFLNRRK